MISSLLFVLLILGALSTVNSKTNIINIGSIFDQQSITGKVSTIAMNAAVNDVNSDPKILPGRRLSLSVNDASFTGHFSIVSAMRYVKIPTVAIISPQSTLSARVLSLYGNELHVPILSFAALDPALSPLQYQYFLQTAPNDHYQMTAIASMVSYFRYREVSAIFTDDDQFRNGINVLSNELLKKRSKLLGKAPLPPHLIVTEEMIKERLLKLMLMEPRVIIVHTYSEIGLKIFEIAESLDMMKKGYVWIATTWLSAYLDSRLITNLNDIDYLYGVLTLRLHTPDSYRKKSFLKRWKNMSNGTIGPNTYALYAYDSIWVIAYAIDKFLKTGGEISFSKDVRLTKIMGSTRLNFKPLSIFEGGEHFLNNILATNMTGLTGPVSFRSDRSLVNPCYDIINILPTQARLIGYWCNNSGLSVSTPEATSFNPPSSSSSSGEVVWPGNAKDKPRGWEFSNNGRPLRIGVPLRTTFKELVMQVNGSKKVGGFTIDVFLAAVKLLKYRLPYEFILYGDGRRNPNYSDLVNKIASNVFDAVVGDITIVTNRTKVVDFTQPYIESGLVVVVLIHKPHSSSWAYLQPFSLQMWVVIALLFIFVGVVVWLLEHRHNDEFRGPPKRQLVTIMWFTFSTMFFAHRENTISTLGRMVVFIWLFVVLIVNSSYTASLTSILTVQQLQSPISGIESLIMGNELIGYPIGSYIESYLVKELNVPASRLVALNSLEYAEKLLSGTVAAIVTERPYVDLFLSNHCQFQVVGQQFTKSGFGFAFPKDSPLAVDISTAILKLAETGELQKIHDRWLNKQACGPQSSSIVSDKLQIQHFWGLFLIFGLVCVVALFIHLCKTVYEFRRDHPRIQRSIQKGHRSMPLQRFMRFMDQKQVAQNMSKRKRMTSGMNDEREV
ncbi:glutamate receptor 3.1-like [Rutidosis leptorrhynchoides]|uniref:glutamate receptor 3.1-like n=1 Tax=Rutidosis leptorrhynchoides TaxID=125765 RepID=UPI003A9A1977